MKNTFKLGLLLLGALALTLTLATAEGKCGNSQKSMMSDEGKCGDSRKGMKSDNEKDKEQQKKGMMNNEGKCGGDMKPKEEPKPAPMKGKCGPGKCG